MKKPKKGDIVICNHTFIGKNKNVMQRTEFDVISISSNGFFIDVPEFSTGRCYIPFDDEDFKIKEPEPTEYMPIISLVLAILIVLLLIFSSFYFKL